MDEFPLERVAAITGCDPEAIAAAARMYATNTPGVIPWTPITDQQRNSTFAIRLHCTLRALTGSLDLPGGEVMHGFHPDIVSESELELHEALPPAQKAKQLGADTHPAFTYRGMERLGEPARRVWGHEYPNIVTGCYMANPTATFRAMATGEPYPVKAFFTLGNNTLMGFANMQRIHAGILNQDLVVAVEHLKTPTAQLADFILPGDAWTERRASRTASAGPRSTALRSRRWPRRARAGRSTTSGGGSRCASGSGSSSPGRRWRRCSTTASRNSA